MVLAGLAEEAAGGRGRRGQEESGRARPVAGPGRRQLPSLRPRLPLPLPPHDELLLLLRRGPTASAVLAPTRRRGAAGGGRRQGGLPRGPLPRRGAREPPPPPHGFADGIGYTEIYAESSTA